MPPKEHRNRARERDALVVERVIGDVLDPFTPTISLGVNYAGQDVINGCQLRPSQVISGPRYREPEATVGIHRFIFVLFRQLGRQTVFAPSWRQNFNTLDFAMLYNLGLPDAAVYFNCQHESRSGCGSK
ncbi:hypothetical protein SAY87_031259 [Trapa incisa]|uniref:Uncharacterized protein n=1 Tax=Trapa incisa TaxID=236973 RepID=A0AAN7KPG6_9MYRT|nr:hypothetical protein SAY87_031259 [Trapa incisa]